MIRSVDEHRSQASSRKNCLIMTVSDTRDKSNDYSGQFIQDLLAANGYNVVDYTIVKDDYDGIRQLLRQAAAHRTIDVVLLSGGTGIAPKDMTYEAVRSLLNKEMPGFGELFRHLSFIEDIGSAAILSRAIAGTISSMAVFSIPGSQAAVKLAMEKIIIPELPHILNEIHKR